MFVFITVSSSVSHAKQKQSPLQIAFHMVPHLKFNGLIAYHNGHDSAHIIYRFYYHAETTIYMLHV